MISFRYHIYMSFIHRFLISIYAFLYTGFLFFMIVVSNDITTIYLEGFL